MYVPEAESVPVIDRLPGCPTRECLAVSGAVGVPGRPSASSGLRERVCRAWLLVTVLVQRHQRLGRRSLVLAERCLHTCPPTTTVRRTGDACTGPGPRGSRGWASASSASPRPPVSPRHGSVRSCGASAPSPPTPHCACQRRSGSTTGSGLTSRPTTTWRSSATCTPTTWPRSPPWSRAELGNVRPHGRPPAELAFAQFSMGASITTTTCSHLCT